LLPGQALKFVSEKRRFAPRINNDMAQTREKHVRDSIMAFFKAAGMRERFEENLAIAFWDMCVGKEISRHTEPLKVAKGIIFVKVDNDVWRNELTYFKHEIIQKINQKLGKKAIKEIKFY
jgi:predicted nucleic acid-binding Zn ribbon protein